jgi:Ser/Thr protein kinase RdoA (MazF antagonist)
VLKIPNRAEDPAVLDLQQSALSHVAAIDPELAIPRLHLALDGARSRSVPGADGARHSIWLLSYLPGRQLGDVRQTARLRRNLGCSIARLARALRGFFHPAAGRELLWDLKHASKLRPHLAEISDRARRQLAEEALDRFDARAAKVLPSLRAQVIHSDANSWNVIVDPADAERIAGIIDFGDIVHSALINDVGIALATAIVDLHAPIEAACEIVAGYHAVTPLQAAELGILLELWLARLAAEVAIAAWRSKAHPENVDYITGSAADSWSMLERLLQLDPDAAQRAFRAACELDGVASHPTGTRAQPESNEQMIARRTRLLGPAYSLFYERPVQIVRGEGVWLYDETGRRYLDALAFSSHGILVPPDDYLKEVFALVRESGGLCVADEVQAGFGRMGAAMWGFETFAVTPDIVTLGKPMGNGHPLAAVVTTPEIAAGFGERLEYFNTFGGNPVSCAAGLAVLDVLEREGLQDNAERVGKYMKAKLSALAESHAAIGDVRGAGLFIGVDLVRDRETREPAPDLARRVANGMRKAGVLIGIDGPAANVLKIRPPMPIQEAQADLLVAALDAQLGPR